MKQGLIIFILTVIVFFNINCKQTVVIRPDQEGEKIQKSETETKTIHTSQGDTTFSTLPAPTVSNYVRVLFYIKSDFPSGGISPDNVYMDGALLVENTSVSTGQHTFVVEKRGYHTKTETLEVTDPDGDGNYPLSTTLEAKERVVIFDIRDQATGEVIIPDQVNVVTMPEGNEKMLADRSLILPGNKKVVIQKQGYIPFSQEILIEADEAPYVLNCVLERN
ncbi:MAG: hypothetical protein KBC30_07975 [Planctomycetes bacterium]|jgi:hypothetical protein|nr:hypothetical protein [Planctomycetota bacterium]HNZ67406.1 hypothetical protein [Planctomycetota bacterium]HPY74535.1 hypothetical protein [Planctomycetota bacterium]HQB00179.1 hypothetical protein [Planctomycetota bacterium]